MKTFSDKNLQAFFALLRAGLWEKEARLSQYDIEYSAIIHLAEEQAVVGLITAGLEHLTDSKASKQNVLQIVGQSIQLELQNKSMNEYLAWLIDRLRKEDIYAILVKGQGIAQCYEKPLWRAPGDIDLLLSSDNYEMAKKVLIPLAIEVEGEYTSLKHLGMTMQGGVVVELHGTLHSRLSKRVDTIIDEAQKDVFYRGNVRSWNNEGTMVYLPSPDNDIIFVFTHILHHFYIEGIGLRQICDWCRLLWTYRESLNQRLLEFRIKEAGLMSEWKAFAALAVDWLGMPVEAMPLHSYEKKWSRKALRIMAYVMESGNFGHNRQHERSGNRILGKTQAAWYKMRDFVRHTLLFPLDSPRFFCHFVINGMNITLNNNNINNS